MKAVNLYSYLKQKEYPGRGIVIGKAKDGCILIGYFIMGRSENSRNRVFVKHGDGIRTEAFDPSKMQDPSLIIYQPVRVLKDCTIVTNGDQTDTIYHDLLQGGTFVSALLTRTYEPDGPNYTPRISGIVKGDSYALSILKSADGDPECPVRSFTFYEKAQAGFGHIIHTYVDNGSPIPSFEGDPVCVELNDDQDTFTEKLWDALNHDNRVSLFTRALNPETGETSDRIINRNVKEN